MFPEKSSQCWVHFWYRVCPLPASLSWISSTKSHVWETEKQSIVFLSVQNIDLQRLAEPAELEEASWTILKQKIDIWFVVFVLPAAQNQWKTAALKEQLKWATYKKKKNCISRKWYTVLWQWQDCTVEKRWREQLNITLGTHKKTKRTVKVDAAQAQTFCFWCGWGSKKCSYSSLLAGNTQVTHHAPVCIWGFV